MVECKITNDGSLRSDLYFRKDYSKTFTYKCDGAGIIMGKKYYHKTKGYWAVPDFIDRQSCIHYHTEDDFRYVDSVWGFIKEFKVWDEY